MKAEYVSHMGTDLSVVNAARVSFDRLSIEMQAQDEKLIAYLAKHDHWTPFAHTAISLRVSAPLPIRTQCFKHKAGFVENEESRRYISSEPVIYIPDAFRSRPTGSIKQGSGSIHPDSDHWRRVYKVRCEDAISDYNRMIADGVCPEQARFILPQGVEVNWIWTGNLAAFARYYRQRTDSHAQVEAQTLAKLIGDIIAPLFPLSWKALTDG